MNIIREVSQQNKIEQAMDKGESAVIVTEFLEKRGYTKMVIFPAYNVLVALH